MPASKRDYEVMADCLAAAMYRGVEGPQGEAHGYPDTFQGGFDSAVVAVTAAFTETGRNFDAIRFIKAVNDRCMEERRLNNG